MRAFRQELTTSFQREGRVLAALVDALATTPQAHSITELSLSPWFGQGWGSLYKALDRGRIDRVRLRCMLAQFHPRPAEGQRLELGLDMTPVLRPCAATLADRTWTHVANAPLGATPVQPGWAFVSCVQLPPTPSAAVYPLEWRRIPSHQTPLAASAQVLQDVVTLLPERPLVKADREYGTAEFLLLIADLPIDVLLRTRKNVVLARPAPPPTGTRGRPRLDGPRFRASDSTTHGPPDAVWSSPDGRVAVAAWHQMHFKKARQVPVTLYQVTRSHARDTARDPRVSWFLGRGPIPLAQVVPWYHGRFSHEHGHRFLKQQLLWATPRLRTPDRFQTWTDVVILTQALLVLAQPLVPTHWRPWDARTRPATLTHVRRSLAAIWPHIAPVPSPPKPRGKSAGRRPGFHPLPAPKHPTIRKHPKKPRKAG